MYGQLIFLLDKAKILKFSRENGGERYVKHFDAWQHLVIMLYAVIKRFDSLRKITDSMFPEARKFSHLGISMMPHRSTLSDANARRPESIFEAAYRDLYATYKDELSSDSRRRQTPKWLSRLQIIEFGNIGHEKNANPLRISVLDVPNFGNPRRERYLSQKEMTLIYLLFNELSTNHLAFPIKTVQIL